MRPGKGKGGNLHGRGKNGVARVTLRDTQTATWEATEFRLRIAMFPRPFPLTFSSKTPSPTKDAFNFNRLFALGLQNVAKRNAKNIFYR
jgi:hypothetical protein